MEETLSPSQEGFICTGSVKLWMGGVLKRKKRLYHLSVQRYSQNTTFSPDIRHFNTLFRVCLGMCTLNDVFAGKFNHYPDRQDSFKNALKRVRISLKRRFNANASLKRCSNESLTHFYALCFL